MSLDMGEDAITSDVTACAATHLGTGLDSWRVSWLPGRVLPRTGAVTAMLLAEAVVNGGVTSTHRPPESVRVLADDLGMTAEDAVLAVRTAG